MGQRAQEFVARGGAEGYTLEELLEALEEQVVLLKVLTAMHDGISISIGEENQSESFMGGSVVSSTYDVYYRCLFC